MNRREVTSTASRLGPMRRASRTHALALLVLCLTWTPEARPDVPQTMSYQGVLTDGSGTPLSGSHSLTFSLYPVPVGGTAIWTETHTTELVQGGYSVILGSATPLAVPFDQPYHLGLSVDGGAELSRTPLAASPYSLSLRLPFFGQVSTFGTALEVEIDHGKAIVGTSESGTGVVGRSILGPGVIGESGDGTGVAGHSFGGTAVTALTQDPSAGGVALSALNIGGGYGITGSGGNVGIYAHNTISGNDAYLSSPCCAADFYGEVRINGTLTNPAGSFRIDHPLDPQGKYLSHSFVESPDMMNIYNGNADLDAAGEAWIELPAWFETLNMDFRYQLTAIGAPGPNLHVAQEIASNRFRIAGGAPGAKVSWQVTGIRHDPYAAKHRIPVEEEKSAGERGRYLHPELYGMSAEQSIQVAHHPEAQDLRRSDRQPVPDPLAGHPEATDVDRIGGRRAPGSQPTTGPIPTPRTRNRKVAGSQAEK